METITEDGRLPLTLQSDWLPGDPDRPAPLSLTASDGTGLSLRSLQARAHIQDPLALTELTLVFDNPESRELEGRFAITLPPGAAVSRFAMKIGDRWQEGEVVEKQRARRIYEDFLHRAQDPALMEKAPGNRFTARVYPIPARSEKHIRIAWSQELSASDAPYVLPLVGLPELSSLSVDVTLESWGDAPPERFVHTAHSARPESDLVVHLGCEDGQVGLRSGDLVVARLKLDLDTAPEPITALTVLLDTSASQGLTLPASVAGLRRILDDLVRHGAGGIPLTVLAFDQVVTEVYEGPLAAFADDNLPAAMGASDLAAALSAVSANDRLLVITDGLPTAGAADLDGLQAALQQTGARRLDAVVVGGIRDEDMLSGLARGVLPRDGVVLDIDTPDLARRIEQATASGITIGLDGADWVHPAQLDGVQPGDEVLVYASLPADAPVRFHIRGARAAPRISMAAVARPLLARSAAQAQIRALTAQHSANPAADLKAAIIDLSVRHRVLSDFTAMLVLETAADYVQYGLDRAALADILSLDDRGVVLLDAREVVLPEAKPERPAPKVKSKKKAARRRSPAPAEEVMLGAPMDEEPSEGAEADDFAGLADMDLMEEEVEEEAVDDIVEMRAPPPQSASAPSGAPAPPPRPAPAPSSAPAPVSRSASAPRRRPRPSAEPLMSSPFIQPSAASAPPAPEAKIPSRDLPLEGRFKTIYGQLQAGQVAAAVADARAWRAEAPGDVLALLALGRALEAAGDEAGAARAIGSMIDLYASRTDLRRAAGERLERLSSGQALAVDTYAVAVTQRPDHPSGHRLLAWALVRVKDWSAALEAIIAGLSAKWPDGRYPGVRRVLLEDLGLIAAGWRAAEPERAEEIDRRLTEAGGAWPKGPSLRLVLSWETDANDVDLHVYDRDGNHAYYSSKILSSGGQLYADVTTGYGPECFVIDGEPAAGPYRVQAHYYRRGPMGYGTGTLQIIRHDGSGGLDISARPFVIMVDNGWIDLGEVR